MIFNIPKIDLETNVILKFAEKDLNLRDNKRKILSNFSS